MEIGDWITLFAVIVALGLGVSSLVQTHRMQKRERRERRLNEIIEWANEITHANFGGEIIVTPGLSERIERRRDSVNRLLYCQELKLKGEELIQQFALSVNSELSNAVSEVILSLNVVVDILNRGVPYNESAEAKELLEANDTVLEKNIRSLIKKVSIYRI